MIFIFKACFIRGTTKTISIIAAILPIALPSHTKVYYAFKEKFA